MLKEINNLRDNDWAHVHVTKRTLTFGDKTFNLNSQLSMDITVPSLTYGEAKSSNPDAEDEEDEEQKKTDEDDDDDEGNTAETDWQIQSVQAMSMTVNMIAVAMRGHRDFCFLVKPAPGSRRVNIVGYQ